MVVKKHLCQILLMMLAFWSCQKVEIGEPDNRLTLSVFRGEIEGMLDTKTTLDKNNNVRWSKGDQILIFNGTTLGSKYQVADDSVGETSAAFVCVEDVTGGFVSGSDIDHNVALYPFDSSVKCAKGEDREPTGAYVLTNVKAQAVQNYAQGSFGPGSFPMVAVTSSISDTRLHFKNVFGGMKLQLKGNCVVSSIKVEGNESEPIAGTVSVTTYVDGSAPVVLMGDDATTSVTLDCGDLGVGLNEDVATDFIIALPPTTFKYGFTVSIVDIEGRLYIIKTSKENKIYRSSLLKMPEVVVDESKAASIELPETEAVISSLTTTFDVNVNANVEYEIIMPDVQWLHWEYASSSSCETFSADENVEYDSRSAEIIFKSKVHDQQRTFTVTQLQRNAIILAKENYEIDIRGGSLEIDLQTNVDFEVSVASDAQSWISYVSTKALDNKVLTLSIAPCSEDVDRIGSVILTKEGLSQTINIRQHSMVSNDPIAFVDANVKKACVAAFDADGDGEVSYKEAAAAKSLDGLYDSYETITSITSFDELRYFTSITSIPSCLFYECKELRSVIFPESLMLIGSSAFEGCSSLSSIVIPDKVTAIGGSAFDGCLKLVSATLGYNLTEIDNGAFRKCSNLSSIVIPDNVAKIGFDAFRDCSSLVSAILGSGLTEVGDYAFSCCSSLSSIVIPDSVTTIGKSSFYNCSNLVSVTIGSGLTEIPESIFSRCKNLVSVSLGSGLTVIGERAFDSCSSLSSIVIPDSVIKIDYYAFMDCSNLVSVTLGSGLTEIRHEAFRGCSSLSSIVIQDNVTKIGPYTFRDCSNLVSVTLGSGLTEIANETFMNCSSLSSVVIPDNVTKIGANAFKNCSNLEGVTLGSGLTVIEEGAFYSCSSLSSIVIPDNVTKIGDNAFRSCSDLSSITIPDNVVLLGASAFKFCWNLVSVALGSGLTKIEQCTFGECPNLISVTLGSGLAEIGEEAFYGCSRLPSIILPENVTTIGSWAFNRCSSLAYIVCYPVSPPTLKDSVFGAILSERIIYVPKASVDAYKSSWSSYASEIRAMTE